MASGRWGFLAGVSFPGQRVAEGKARLGCLCPDCAHGGSREPLPVLIPVLSVLQMACERSDVFASACALARAFPLFTHRSGASRRTEKKTVTVEFFLVGQDNGPVEVSTLQVGVRTFRQCAWAVRRSVWGRAPPPAGSGGGREGPRRP